MDTMLVLELLGGPWVPCFFSRGSINYLGGGNSNIFYFQPYLGKSSNLTHMFQLGWNHQLAIPAMWQERKPKCFWERTQCGLRVAWSSLETTRMESDEMKRMIFLLIFLMRCFEMILKSKLTCFDWNPSNHLAEKMVDVNFEDSNHTNSCR